MRAVFSALMLGVLATAGAAPALAQTPVSRSAYTVEPFTPPAQITIQGAGVRLRAEPFATKDTPVLSSGSTGLALTVVGITRQSDWNWYQVVLRNGQKAFIRSDFTTAPSRGGGMTDYAGQAYGPGSQPVTSQPAAPQPIAPLPAAPRSVRVEPINPIQTAEPYQPQPYPAQPALPPIATHPAQSGAISLTPGGGGGLALPLPSSNPSPDPALSDPGLLSISPAPPTPRFSDGASAGPAGSVAEQIRAQLDTKRCWTDSSSMMDAQRLKASFLVSLTEQGRFAADPLLVSPSVEPGDDPAMMVFIAKARAALRTCNALGFDVPQAYFANGHGDLQLDFAAR